MINPTKKQIPMEMGLARSDKTRLWIFGILFVLVLGSFLGLRLYSGSGGDPNEGRGGFENMLDKGQRGPVVDLPVTEINPSWETQIGELTYAAANNVDERPFWLVLNFAKNLGVDGYAAKRASENFEIEVFAEGAGRMLRMPETFRFRYVAMAGRITEMFFDEEIPENPGEIDRMFAALLTMPDGDVVRLVSPHAWGEFAVEPTVKPLRVEGIFYKRWKYQGVSGRTESAPLVIVTGLFRGDEE